MYLQKSQLATKIGYLLMIFIIFFFPTSIDGVILKSNIYTYTYYGICLIVIMWYGVRKLKRKTAILRTLALMIYLLIASFISIIILDGTMSIARLVSMILTIIVIFFDSNKMVPSKFVMTINEILTLVIIFWNCGIIFNVKSIQNLTIQYFSQFNWFTTSVFVGNSKPVFTFGIYSYGAFFYAMLFIFWMYVAFINKDTNSSFKYRFYIYAFFFIVFQILMSGSTALLLGLVMILGFLGRIWKSKWSILVIPILLVSFFYFIRVQEFDWNRIVFGTSTNGFAVRYHSDWFHNNFLAVKETVLGIGYTIPTDYDLVYSDSGYMVLFTMGNIFLPLVLYINLFKSLKRNLPKEVYRFSWIIIMLFELALPGLLYPKEIIFIAYFYLSVQAITRKENYNVY